MEWWRIERPLTIRFAEALVPKRLASLVEPRGGEENEHVVKLTLKSFVLYIWSIQQRIYALQNALQTYGELSYSCHHQASRMALFKERWFRLLRTNSSKATFEQNIKNFKSLLNDRGYPASVVKKHLSEVLKFP